MRTAHLLSDDLFEEAMEQIQAGNQFLAYNSSQYLLEKGDIQFFPSMEEANEFAINNHSDRDFFYTMRATSVMDIYDHFEIAQALMEHPQLLSQLKKTNMDENNYDYLCKQMQWVGFGDALKEELKSKLIAGEKEFTLQHQVSYGKDNITASLQFRKPDNGDRYFFNRYQLELQNDHFKEPIKQTFFINKDQHNITLKEGYNLLSGRAAHKELSNKEGEKYMAWVQLDFKQTEANGNYKMRSFNENWGFNLTEALNRLPIKELNATDTKEELMKSLERGNRQQVTFEADGKEKKVFIEAAPANRALNYYDSNMKKTNLLELLPQAATQSEKNGQQQGKELSKNKAPDDELEEKTKSKRNARSQAM